jgi:flagellar capping protein FliD
VDLPKIETEVTKLDDAMTALQAKYLKQFSAMQSAVLSAKSTQDSLTQSMSAWTAGLK